MNGECHETLSGMHVYHPDSHECRCGVMASPLDLAMLEAQRQRIAAGTYIKRRTAAPAA